MSTDDYERGQDFYTSEVSNAGRVVRYHTWATVHKQTVGEACWQVALVYERIFGPPSAEVERYIRHHDTAELVVGDPPFPVKARNTMLKDEYDRLEVGALVMLGISLPVLTPKERSRVKVADLLEMMVFGMFEVQMGNKHAVPIVERTEVAATEVAKQIPEDLEAVRRFVDDQWSRHRRVLQSGLVYMNHASRSERYARS
jgi:5'-deoxynucleotidase YfbR-like HD superfamily hydrolase